MLVSETDWHSQQLKLNLSSVVVVIVIVVVVVA
jgi:hypothetical protein